MISVKIESSKTENEIKQIVWVQDGCLFVSESWESGDFIAHETL